MKKENEITVAKSRAIRAVDRLSQPIIALSHRIHSKPELGLAEIKASRWLGSFLEKKGFKTEYGIGNLNTAIRAVYGSRRPRVALLAEYDALPGLGHACGHNIIAASSVGAAVASKFLVEHIAGSIVVIGTPAEESVGGKIELVESGVFNDIDSVMMVHPASRNVLAPKTLACVSLSVEFLGKEAHAAVRPEQGINALEAMIIAYNAINSLRQHIPDSARVHGIIKDGGSAPNIVPAHSSGDFLVRAADLDNLKLLKQRVLDCFKGAAVATGSKFKYKWGRTYAPLKSNLTLAGSFGYNLELLGRKLESAESRFGFGSSDMGNVSQVAPTIHPDIAITSPETSIHSPEFALAAISKEGDKGVLDAAKVMAMTLADLFLDPELLGQIKKEFTA